MTNKFLIAAAAVAALVAFPVIAQVDATEVSPREMTEPVADVGSYNVTAQAGVGTFVGGGELGSRTGIGPTWGVQLEGPLARAFGWEVGYRGSRTPVDDSDAALWRHGVDGFGKVYAPVEADIRPFAGAGVGASWVVTGADGYRNNLIAEIPLGAGVEYAPAQNNLTAGVRGTYRLLLDQNIVEDSPEGGGGMVGASLTVGGKF